MYPYSELIPLLKHTLSVSEYRLQKREVFSRYLGRASDQEALMGIVPCYLYAICPICQAVCSAYIDTYTLPSNQLPLTLDPVIVPPRGYPKGWATPCPHFLGIQTFLNLHNQEPKEVSTLHLYNGEVPLVTPWFLNDQDKGSVVLHALPVCRIVGNAFVPAYTRFFLTYFCADPAQILENIYSAQAEDARQEDDYQPYTIATAYQIFHQRHLPRKHDGWEQMTPPVRAYYEEKYDLSRWARIGKLGYLDFTDLKLHLGQNLELPAIYQQIAGRKYWHFWSDGQFYTY
ncbi:MAG TPA: hypothetical protein VHO69_07740 [Phototrophicaceae bacterium]|nr:hypothetical protein [Phototrophicaceae bacterium]